jgi:hypothetical protein
MRFDAIRASLVFPAGRRSKWLALRVRPAEHEGPPALLGEPAAEETVAATGPIRGGERRYFFACALSAWRIRSGVKGERNSRTPTAS